MMRTLKTSLLILAAALAGCTEDVTKVTEISCKPTLWNAAAPVQPPCTVAVNFVVDDSANAVFLDAEAQWKGSFQYDGATRIAYHDGSWNGGNGPFAPLYDDGPWTAGGHEPIGQVADDHILGVTMFVHPPASGSVTFEYGLVDNAFNDGWIWVGGNGSFVVAAGATAPISAPGLTFAAFGTTDVALTLDTGNLDAGATWDTSTVEVKGSGWAWNEITMRDDGVAPDTTAADGIYVFVLSEHAGIGNTYYHTGLAASGQQVQFVFVLGNTEYKVSSVPPTAGVSAQTMRPAASWIAATVGNLAGGDQNTYITAPTY